jgi:hypothetical protein
MLANLAIKCFVQQVSKIFSEFCTFFYFQLLIVFFLLSDVFSISCILVTFLFRIFSRFWRKIQIANKSIKSRKIFGKPHYSIVSFKKAFFLIAKKKGFLIFIIYILEVLRNFLYSSQFINDNFDYDERSALELLSSYGLEGFLFQVAKVYYDLLECHLKYIYKCYRIG